MPFILHTILYNTFWSVYIVTKEKYKQLYSKIKTFLSLGCCKNKALTKEKYNQNETNENMFMQICIVQIQRHQIICYTLNANSSLNMNENMYPSLFLPKRTFRSNDTFLSRNYTLLFWKLLSHRKTFDIDNFTTNMISKIFCPLSPKSQSMTCFDNSKRAQIKHNKV